MKQFVKFGPISWMIQGRTITIKTHHLKGLFLENHNIFDIGSTVTKVRADNYGPLPNYGLKHERYLSKLSLTRYQYLYS